MNTFSKINELAKNNPQKLISGAENEYHNEVDSIAKKIVSNSKCKIVLLAGPSGSGKTTTAHILCDCLAKRNEAAAVVSLDNFYLPADKMPKLENGNPDYESVFSLDITEIKRCFAELIETNKTSIPIFDFTKHRRSEKRLDIDVSNNGILIVEGLHALNTVLTEDFDLSCLYKIYISVNCSVMDDSGNVMLTSRQMRLCRRISRDYIYRSSLAQSTLKLWTSVVAGEKKYLYCFKNTADTKLVTFHAFEPGLFAGIIPQMLDGLTKETDNYDYVMKTRCALEKFYPIDSELIPDNSLIREFIKGGIYESVT